MASHGETSNSSRPGEMMPCPDVSVLVAATESDAGLKGERYSQLALHLEQCDRSGLGKMVVAEALSVENPFAFDLFA